MAFGSTIDLLDIGVRDLIESGVAVFAAQFPMHRVGIAAFINIENSLVPLFIVPPHTGVAVAKQAVFRIR